MRINYSHIKIFLSLCFLSFCFEKCNTSKQTVLPSDKAATYSYDKPSSEGTGKFYMGREIAKVDEAFRQLAPQTYDREKEQRPDLVIEKLHLSATSIVADVGAGSGYFTFKISPKVPLGKVYAVEIQNDLIDFLNKEKNELNYKNIEVIKGSERSPNLPDNSIDVVLLIITYHEFEYPHEILQAIRKSLKSDGKILLMERGGEDAVLSPGCRHAMKAKQIKKEFIANRFTVSYRGEFLPKHHVFIFKKNNSI